jgi:hypothetical protein
MTARDQDLIFAGMRALDFHSPFRTLGATSSSGQNYLLYENDNVFRQN